MPLSPAIEFISAQRGSSGDILAAPGGSQLAAVIPPNTRFRVSATPMSNIYSHYTFRVMLDEMMVPGAFQIWVYSFGVVPYSGIMYPSTRGEYLDTFLRVTHSQPVVYEAINLTNLNQWFVIYTQHYTVATEENYKELERRLDDYFNQDSRGRRIRSGA